MDKRGVNLALIGLFLIEGLPSIRNERFLDLVAHRGVAHNLVHVPGIWANQVAVSTDKRRTDDSPTRLTTL